jgi:hypothetical protein
MKTAPLNIEIVDLPLFLALSAAQKQSVVNNLRQLQERGHAIWLDDIDETIIQPFLSCRLPLTASKSIRTHSGVYAPHLR